MSKHPNIVLIITDQQRLDTLSCMGNSVCRTPNIDRLAAEGICFDRALSPSPICGPARTSIFTGLYAHQACGELEEGGIADYKGEIKRDGSQTNMLLNDAVLQEPPLLTDALKEQGYHCAYAGKWHLGNEIIGNWFDQYDGHRNQDYVDWLKKNNVGDGWPLNDYSVRTERLPNMSIPVAKKLEINAVDQNDAWITDIGLRFIEERSKDQPLFLVCSMNGPHPPFKIPEPYFSLYDPEAISKPPNFSPNNLEPEGNGKSFYRTLWRDHGNDWESWKKSWAVYYGFCSLIDDQVGRIFNCLQNENLIDDTMIIFCSDHGEQLGQHGLWHKMQAYEESLRVPLIISAPWITNKRHSNANVSLLDIPSTILAAAGVPIPDSFEGKDLTDLFETDDGMKERKYLFSEQKPLGGWHGEAEWRMVTDNRFKYIWNHEDVDEFFDLKNDPHEMENIINKAELQQELNILKQQLFDWMQRTKDPKLSEYDEYLKSIET